MLQKCVSKLKLMLIFVSLAKISVNVRAVNKLFGVDKSQYAEEYDHKKQKPFPLDLKVNWMIINNNGTNSRMQRNENDNSYTNN